MVRIYTTLWWDDDYREYGCPIEVSIHTRRYHWLIRPFSKTQAYDWKRGCWTGWNPETGTLDPNQIVWTHIARSPEHPEIWKKIARSH